MISPALAPDGSEAAGAEGAGLGADGAGSGGKGREVCAGDCGRGAGVGAAIDGLPEAREGRPKEKSSTSVEPTQGTCSFFDVNATPRRARAPSFFNAPQ